MKFAILGTDPDLVALVAAAAADGHTFAWLGDVRPEDEPALRRSTSLPAAGPDEWETLLDHAIADAVLVGRGAASEELRVEQLKRLVADAVPLLVVHPAGPSLLAYYELDMVERETRAILRHYNPLIGHPLEADFARWVRAGNEMIGAVAQVVCTRHVASGSRREVLDALARDVELLSAVGGDIRRVSAMGPPYVASDNAAASPTISYASLQVQMTTSGPATLRWSLVPSSGGPLGSELTLVGEQGQIVWDQRQQTLTHGSEVSTPPPFDAPRTAIRELVFTIEHQDVDAHEARPVVRSTWDRATRAMEVVDTVELSLQKGRTIEVYQQQLTEQLAFRGTMAALGCGLLLLGTFVLIVAGIAGGADWLVPRSVMTAWPIVVLAVLAFFLLLQCVPALAARQKARRQRKDESLVE